jgi:hypothetical protein
MQYHKDRARRGVRPPVIRAAPQKTQSSCSGPQGNNISACNAPKKQRSKPSQLSVIQFRPKDTIPSQKQPKFTRTSQRLRHAQVDECKLSSTNRPSPIDSPQRPESGDTGINQKSCLSVGHTQTPACEPTVTNRELDRPVTTTTPGNWSSDSTRSISSIHDFLQNCSPPLNHILSRFIDLGFQSPDMLREVAHKWTTEERRDLMKRLAPGPKGNRMNELELAALERGFQGFRTPGSMM